ncbi:GNAT family N-acetyltransferase [Rossellomorea sp. BNER]|uniref:GNAT family N-acetyltransferase n=1 Tax=Rossellomorea sp. BNER TaxID=2962031 RepID=UPI003AF2CA25|nr:GNAT family N-acetyltransferase [Rossellomorea sp. BNER]
MKKFDYGLETERLVIRPLREDDFKNWFNQFENRLPSQHRYDKGKMDMSECTDKWFNNLVAKHQELGLNDTAYVFGVFRKNGGTHLGMVDFSTLARNEFQWGRIGYTIHNQFFRKGYGKEAVKGALSIAFNDLKYHRIEAHINMDNTASISLAECVGMKFECVREGFIYEFGDWTDHKVFYINSKNS